MEKEKKDEEMETVITIVKRPVKKDKPDGTKIEKFNFEDLDLIK
jgi:hypothetical protein